MRPPLRAVVDDHVDRPQVGAWRHVEPSGTNCPNASALRPRGGAVRCVVLVPAFARPSRPLRHEWRLWRGGAPLPIPNREVKPRRDDDTAGDRGKVVRRPPIAESPSAPAGGLICFYTSTFPITLPSQKTRP